MKTKYFLFALTLLGAALALSSCDKIKHPVIGSHGGGDTTHPGKIVRKILIEDFTAQQCVNCPKAAGYIEDIKEGKDGYRVISIGEHVGGLAKPGTVPPYTYDFRTSTGDTYANAMGAGAQLPSGTINRMDFPSGTVLKDYRSWATSTTKLLTTLPAPDAEIRIANNYDSSSQKLTTTITTKFLNSIIGTYNLVVLLTEDSIIKPQVLPDGTDNLTYIHRHVLRDRISTSDWGDQIKSGSIKAGDFVVRTLNYQLPLLFPVPPKINGIAPVEKHCYVVAYIYDADKSSPRYYEVIQVEEKKITVK